MQNRPDRVSLLLAIARFLEKDVRPALARETGLAFRALVAANLAAIVAGETAFEDALLDGELGRLRALLPDVPMDESALVRAAGKREAILRLNRELAARIRARSVSREARFALLPHLQTTLKDELAITNPRFDTTADVP
jgi:hypothetical protein